MIYPRHQKPQRQSFANHQHPCRIYHVIYGLYWIMAGLLGSIRKWMALISFIVTENDLKWNVWVLCAQWFHLFEIFCLFSNSRLILLSLVICHYIIVTHSVYLPNSLPSQIDGHHSIDLKWDIYRFICPEMLHSDSNQMSSNGFAMQR